MRDYEKLGAFYLGRTVDRTSGETSTDPFLYDAKDLTTHAVCVGMTGSGKTGLAITLIEEALLDGVPVIAIDPKGDLGNLMLAFPQLREADFRPWIDPGDAARKGRTPDEHARATAELWRNGLSEWDQGPERIAALVRAAERTIYTPGSQSGNPLAILKSFSAPGPALLDDTDAFRERVAATVSGLLALVGITANPIRSREHILLSIILDRSWREGRDLDLATLIQKIQNPGIQRVGVMDLDTFCPPPERFELAMTLNNLMASPGFSAWTQGEPLDIGKLLYTPDGRPRLSIVSIAHLPDPERMFLVTTLLNEIVAWMRNQPGSRTLRALLYMDEVFGYFPPTANPPSKIPMLTLLKQARAFGLGVVLSTQNPVDLDYKGLSNAGTWFLGRLQTERDKARVIEGLEGASAAASAEFDRQEMERLLAGLDNRVFLMNNVHEDRPTLFQTRWAMSYLAGPLTSSQIKTLAGTAPTPDPVQEPSGAPTGPAVRAVAAAPAAARVPDRPVLPSAIREAFLAITRAPGDDDKLLYRPALLAEVTLHYAKASVGVDDWRRLVLLERIDDDNADSPWDEVDHVTSASPELADEPRAHAHFADLAAAATQPKNYVKWAKMLKSSVYRTHSLRLLSCKRPKLHALPGESDGEFRGRLSAALREARDLEIEKLRTRYAPKLARLDERVKQAEHRIEKEEEQYKEQRTSTAISIGATLVGALFGRKLGSSRNIGRAATAMRGVGRASRERGDIERAEERLEAEREKLAEMGRELEESLRELQGEIAIDESMLHEVVIAPSKSDIAVDSLRLVWTPWRVDKSGVAEPCFET